MAYIRVTKDMTRTLDAQTLAKILKQNPKLRNRVGSLLRPGDVVRLSYSDLARGNVAATGTPAGKQSKGNYPGMKSTPLKPVSSKVKIIPGNKPPKKLELPQLRPLVPAGAPVHPALPPAVAPQVTYRPVPAPPMPQEQPPKVMGPSGIGSVPSQPVRGLTYARPFARFDTESMAENEFNRMQSQQAEQRRRAVEAMEEFRRGLMNEPSGGSPIAALGPGGLGRVMAAQTPAQRVRTPEQREDYYSRAVATSALPMPRGEEWYYVPRPNPLYGLISVGHFAQIVNAMANGYRPLVIPQEVQTAVGLSDLEMERDWGYVKDDYGNWVRREVVGGGEVAGPATGAGGSKRLYESTGWGRRRSSGGGGGYGGGGFGYLPEIRKQWANEMAGVTWRI